ncbi:MAG: PEP-CTERM sorting domain-containing protein, partial [Cyanobacteria bacterium J06642_11]
GGGHINLINPVMYPFISASQRKLLTGIDVLASAYLGEFQSLNLNPQQQAPEVPESSLGTLTENGSFETGTFEGWQTIGNTSLETAALGISPTDGQLQAFLSTGGTTVSDKELETFLELFDGQLDQLSDQLVGAYPVEESAAIESLDIAAADVLDSLGNGDATFGSAIKQTFSANAGDILSFDWNFVTNEATPSSVFNDFGFVSIGLLETLADTNANFVNSLSPFNEETGFQEFSFALPETGDYTLGLGVVDVADSIIDSGLIVDNVRLTRSKSVPEPSAISALALLGLFGLRKRLQQRRSA